ncbi:MAG: hypothetical protein WC426_14105, partial [Sulfuriferula sp.]
MGIESLAYKAAYPAIGAAVGYFNFGEEHKLRNAVVGALGGIAARNLPGIARNAIRLGVGGLEVASYGSFAYGVKKGLVDGAVSKFTHWLDNTKPDVSWKDASTPYLFQGRNVEVKMPDGTTRTYKNQTDWAYALSLGTALWGVTKIGSVARQAYLGGERAGIHAPKGFFRGIAEGWNTRIWSRGAQNYGAAHPFKASAIMLGTGYGMYKMGTTDINDNKFAKYYGFGGTPFGAALKWTGIATMGLGTLSLAAQVSRFSDRMKFGSRISGTALALEKTLLWDLGVHRTGVNLLTVIAPLQGIIEGVSAFTQRYVVPSAFTPVEQSMWSNTFGAFLNAESLTKYQDNINAWDKAQGFWNKLGVAGRFAETAYLSGLFGTTRGMGMGENKVKSFGQLWDTFNSKGSREIVGLVDRENVWFSASLAVLSPLAEPAFSNIRFANGGRIFQALGKGMERTLGELGITRSMSSMNQSTSFSSRFLNRFSNLTISGTVEEAVPEQIAQQVLNFIPGMIWHQRLSEVAQEIITPNRYSRINAIPTQHQAVRWVDRGLAELSRTNVRGQHTFQGQVVTPQRAQQLRDALTQSRERLTATGASANLGQLRTDIQQLQTIGMGNLSEIQRDQLYSAQSTLALANGTGIYDPTHVTQALLPVMQIMAEDVAFSGRNTIRRLAADSLSSTARSRASLAADHAAVRAFAFNRIDRGDGAGKTSAQASEWATRTDRLQLGGGYHGYVAVDVGQNFDFDLGFGGSMTVRSNLIGEYNYGAGAHEFMHLSIEDSRQQYDQAWYRSGFQEIQRLHGNQVALGARDLLRRENNPNEMLVMNYSLRETARFLRTRPEFIALGEGSGIHAYVMPYVTREKADFADTMNYVSSLDNNQLMSMVVDDVTRRYWKWQMPRRLHWRVDSLNDYKREAGISSPLTVNGLPLRASMHDEDKLIGGAGDIAVSSSPMIQNAFFNNQRLAMQQAANSMRMARVNSSPTQLKAIDATSFASSPATQKLAMDDLLQRAARQHLNMAQKSTIDRIQDFIDHITQQDITIQYLDDGDFRDLLKRDGYIGAGAAGYHLETITDNGRRIIAIPKSIQRFSTPSGLLADVTFMQRVSGWMRGKLD